MLSARRFPKKPIGFRPLATMFKLGRTVDYKKEGDVRGSVIPNRTQFIVISRGMSKQTDQPETNVYAANREGLCLSWLTIAPPIAGYPDHSHVLASLGYKLA